MSRNSASGLIKILPGPIFGPILGLPGRKSGFRAGFRPDSNPGKPQESPIFKTRLKPIKTLLKPY